MDPLRGHLSQHTSAESVLGQYKHKGRMGCGLGSHVRVHRHWW
jgi:hypothetical protein